MYSKIHSRLNWFFQYIGEPEEDFVVELYGDVNFDGSLAVSYTHLTLPTSDLV